MNGWIRGKETNYYKRIDKCTKKCMDIWMNRKINKGMNKWVIKWGRQKMTRVSKNLMNKLRDDLITKLPCKWE